MFLENAWDGITLNPAQEIKHAEAQMILENRNFGYIKFKYWMAKIY